MQGTFAVPVAANSYEKISAGPSGSVSGSVGTKKTFEEDGGQDTEASFFASFMAALVQAVENPAEENADPSLAENSFELALSAFQEEREAALSSSGDTSFLFSKSILDVLSPLKAELEKEGVDVGALSEKMGEALEEALPGGLGAERLDAMLSVLRKRYPAAPRASDSHVPNADTTDMEPSVSEASEAAPSLSSSPLALASAESMGLEESGAEGLSSGDETATAAQILAVSRFRSYLKGDAARAPASSKAMKAEKAGKSDGLSEEKSAGQEISGQAAAFLAVSEGREGSEPGLSDARESVNEKTSQSEGFKNDFAQSASQRKDAAEAPAGKGQGGETQKSAAVEHPRNFEQFFEGVMARRDQPDLRAGALELGSGAPLAQDEALREGLTNVVRFIRASGEQKASLVVDPPALGRVSVELTSNAAGLEASIKVSSEQVRQLVQDQLAQLRWSLAQQGVQLTHFSVDVQQEDGGRRQQETGRERRRTRGVSGLEDGADVQDEQAGFRVDLDQGLLYWVA